MKTIRVKMDYNNLVEKIDRTVSASRSNAARENALSIGIGLALLNGYLTEIAKRAIELNDEKLIDLCVDMGILKQVEEK